MLLFPGGLHIAPIAACVPHVNPTRMGDTGDVGGIRLKMLAPHTVCPTISAAAVATFVFCSVPDPVLGLRELKRMVRPGEQVFLLGHVRSANPVLGALMDTVNPPR